MLSPGELLDRALLFLEQGGPALWVILMLSFLMWLLILERYWFLHFQGPALLTEIRFRARRLAGFGPAAVKRQSSVLVGRVEEESKRSLGLIQALSETLPLLGLLGTVSGMIQSFDVISVFGNGNVRGMAGGISQALLTTMAGLVTALSGLYFSSHLRDASRRLVERALEVVESF